MSLLDEALALATSRGGRCTVGILHESFGPAEQAELDEAFESPVSSSAISRALKVRGHEISPDVLQRHRRGDCKCP